MLFQYIVCIFVTFEFLEISQGGLLVVCRLWRLVRIGEAIGTLKEEELEEHALHGGTKDDIDGYLWLKKEIDL